MNWCYVSLYEVTETNPNIFRTFPSTPVRMLAGSTICGLLMCAVFVFVKGGMFATMPLWTGSLSCDIFMFYMGIQAKRNEWFSTTKLLRDQLDINIWTLRLITVIEATGMFLSRTIFNSGMLMDTPWMFPILYFVFAGLFCL